MGKIIFWLVVFFVVLFVLRLVNVANSRSRRERARPRSQGTAMIRCVDCGVYLPSADATQGPRGRYAAIRNACRSGRARHR